jgi:hypothetical protein
MFLSCLFLALEIISSLLLITLLLEWLGHPCAAVDHQLSAAETLASSP